MRQKIFECIEDLYNDYIYHLTREDVEAKLFVLDKYNILVGYSSENGILMESWEHSGLQEIEKNQEIFEKLVNENYYDIHEALEMQKIIFYREQRIRMGRAD